MSNHAYLVSEMEENYTYYSNIVGVNFCMKEMLSENDVHAFLETAPYDKEEKYLYLLHHLSKYIPNATKCISVWVEVVTNQLNNIFSICEVELTNEELELLVYGLAFKTYDVHRYTEEYVNEFKAYFDKALELTDFECTKNIHYVGMYMLASSLLNYYSNHINTKLPEAFKMMNILKVVRPKYEEIIFG